MRRDQRGGTRATVIAGVGLIAAIAGALLVWVIRTGSSTGGTRRVAQAYNGLTLDSEFHLLAERRFGSDGCLLGECPRVDRYYTTALTVGGACIAIAPELTGWASDVRPVPGPRSAGPSCGFTGKKDGFDLNVTIAADTTVESEEASRTVEEPVTVAHNAVILISLTDPE